MPVCPTCEDNNPQLGAKCPRCNTYYIYEDALDDAEHDKYIGTLAAEKYVILAQISEGGMGTIYRALQLPVEREVALKVLRTELEDNDEVRKRFVREARAVSALSHPNIITLHDFGFDGQDHPYMVMEFAPGNNLGQWMQRADLTLDRVLAVARQILSALSDAHDQGIVHRDLKPENMIVTDAGAQQDFIKLLDFGIARLVNQEATKGLTREGEVFGTPHYMAPEQAQGETGIGAPADVYAMGIMMYEMLSGDTPFDAPTPLAILFKQINEELPPLTARNGWELPPWVTQLIDRATHKSPENRYQTAGDMFDALEHGLEHGTLPDRDVGGAGVREADNGTADHGADGPTNASGDSKSAQSGGSTDLQFDATKTAGQAQPTAQSDDAPKRRETPGELVDVDDPNPTDTWFSDTATVLRPWYEADRTRQIAIFVGLIALAGTLTLIAFSLAPAGWGEDAQATAGGERDGGTTGSGDTGVASTSADADRLAGPTVAEPTTDAGRDATDELAESESADTGTEDDESQGARAGDPQSKERQAGTGSTGSEPSGEQAPDKSDEPTTSSSETSNEPTSPPASGDETAADNRTGSPSTGTTESDDSDDVPPEDSDSEPGRFGSPDDIPTKFGAPEE